MEYRQALFERINGRFKTYLFSQILAVHLKFKPLFYRGVVIVSSML